MELPDIFLSKAVKALIDHTAKFIGDALEPQQIRRIAKAKVDAALIEAEGDIVVEDLHRRTARRWIKDEMRDQINMEDIRAASLPQLNDDARPNLMDDDWTINFFDKCRKTSDKQMRNLWSRILAGEANSPGSFSRRTVNFVAELDKSEAELFSTLCRFSWRIKSVHPLIVSHQDEIYNEYGINYTSLSHLASIGLVDFHSLGQYNILGITRDTFIVSYFEKSCLLDISGIPKKKIETGQIKFTKIGEELAPLCDSRQVDGFFDYVLEKWSKYSPKPV